ncbi:MAG: hypothetical protein LIP28_05850, partial [Deltaproteobacteria bacterium]|nr:hypothetical protein [Deltaproteobacteria bacterium]
MPASLSTEKAKGSLLARMAGQFGAFETLRDADASIHAAKIHLNKAVKRKNGIHVTGLADHIGITVG